MFELTETEFIPIDELDIQETKSYIATLNFVPDEEASYSTDGYDELDFN